MTTNKNSLALLTDFDDTAAVQNVAEMLLRQFGNTGWMDIRQQFRDGSLSLMEYQEIVFSQIDENADNLGRYAIYNSQLRPGFLETYEFCNSMEIPMAVVSLGLDLYIRPILKHNGLLDVPVYCVETYYSNDKLNYSYKYTDQNSSEKGLSKGMVVNSFKDLGYTVLYVGDGRSDFEAARTSDIVMARSILIEECKQNDIEHLEFEDFYDVLDFIKSYTHSEG
ncbi:MAG TPA: hypothetical protein DEZ08_00655 [Dehalococcoidia bacterium]|jgi:2-hydroxy-3-keto-5-methylthiopentenyl-1-phosphate phosphatase|nr:hypothetical protein [Dehalococcoidia bacterium]|tara:strand:+ start:479 stop:1147 length:669 start_codon:yes stop_codon:yes gene_type:complete